MYRLRLPSFYSSCIHRKISILLDTTIVPVRACVRICVHIKHSFFNFQIWFVSYFHQTSEYCNNFRILQHTIPHILVISHHNWITRAWFLAKIVSKKWMKNETKNKEPENLLFLQFLLLPLRLLSLGTATSFSPALCPPPHHPAGSPPLV